MKIIKYIAQIPYEVMIDWNESRTDYTEIICEREEEAIQIFRNIIANNFTYLENNIQGHFYIVKRVIDIEKCSVQNTELYYASIYNKRINGTGINKERAYLSDTPSSCYKEEFYEYQKEIKQLLIPNLPTIEEQEKIKKLYLLIDNMRDESLHYNDIKDNEERYKKMKWWEN